MALNTTTKKQQQKYFTHILHKYIICICIYFYLQALLYGLSSFNYVCDHEFYILPVFYFFMCIIKYIYKTENSS